MVFGNPNLYRAMGIKIIKANVAKARQAETRPTFEKFLKLGQYARSELIDLLAGEYREHGQRRPY